MAAAVCIFLFGFSFNAEVQSVGGNGALAAESRGATKNTPLHRFTRWLKIRTDPLRNKRKGVLRIRTEKKNTLKPPQTDKTSVRHSTLVVQLSL
ncbi:hypothetical protein NFI96_010162 [Prochilodus magdalenae]|nr:hypothetical protein NFI96_010162 [Prochilodus magdalenae]